MEQELQVSEIDKCKSVIGVREKQLVDMAEVIADLNEQLNDSQLKEEKLNKEVVLLKKKLEKKDQMIQQYMNDKELMFSKLSTAERENDRLRKQKGKGNDNNLMNNFTSMWNKISNKKEEDNLKQQKEVQEIQAKQQIQIQEKKQQDQQKQKQEDKEKDKENENDKENQNYKLNQNQNQKDNENKKDQPEEVNEENDAYDILQKIRSNLEE